MLNVAGADAGTVPDFVRRGRQFVAARAISGDGYLCRRGRQSMPERQRAGSRRNKGREDTSAAAGAYFNERRSLAIPSRSSTTFEQKSPNNIDGIGTL